MSPQASGFTLPGAYAQIMDMRCGFITAVSLFLTFMYQMGPGNNNSKKKTCGFMNIRRQHLDDIPKYFLLAKLRKVRRNFVEGSIIKSICA